MSELNVQIKSKEKSYPIFINNDDLANLHTSILSFIKDKKYIIVCSQKVYKLYGKFLNFPKERIFILKDGEKEKNIENYEKILDFALSKKLTRQDYIIALGGGVVGDITGFAAASYMRGINYIQVPTTLLSCIDSSVGGKTAVNSKYGKNLIGAFYQPKAVFININFLKTLDTKQFLSGMGEAIKYGFIEKSCPVSEDYDLISFINKNADKILSGNSLILAELIEICIKLKISVVSRDEQETGLRRILNFGHTYAHALEAISHYKKYTHGQCVAQGILFALNLSYKLNKIDKEYKFLCEDLIKKFNYPKIPHYNKEKIINLMLADKKASGKGVIFILSNGYAQVEQTELAKEDLEKLI